ncbi:MAG TPA: tripartite tricarboxylate transporter substrate-binding protein, partial [Burkholderiales bacterium]|nr:tripartite tricarboxylate transporter substrate-binding protein [Burkholderiales bacterium]
GATAMMPDLMSGQVPIGIVSALAGVSQAKSGKIRALAVTSAQRLPNAPEIPALSETIPGFEAAPNVFLVAPAGFASERLASAVRQVVTSPEVQDSFAKQGATPMPVEPRELAARIAAEVRRWAAVVKDAGIKAE